MKKNKMMRTASVLLVAVLLSTCAICGTFAKYVTAHSDSDEARIAYWGFKETTFEIDDLFQASYESGKVASKDGTDDVIAPGTAGQVDFSFKPQNEKAPEVAYKITVSTTGSEIANDIATNPNIQWKLDNGEYGTFAKLLNAINGLSTGDTPIAANSFHTNWDASSTHTVYWQWLINEDSDANNAQNMLDTTLANKGTLDKVKLVISIVAEQVD